MESTRVLLVFVCFVACVQAQGSGSGDSTILTPADCGSLEDPQNGVVTYTTTTPDSEAMYSCNDGYPLIPLTSETRTCQSEGTWTPEEPRCGCGEPPIVLNANRTLDGLDNENGTVSYMCIAGYERVGASMLTCGTEGWEPSEMEPDFPMCTAMDSTTSTTPEPTDPISTDMLTPAGSGVGSGDSLTPDDITPSVTQTSSGPTPTTMADIIFLTETTTASTGQTSTVLSTETPTATTDSTPPATALPPAVFIQISFNATLEEFNTDIMPVLVAVLWNITNTSAELVVIVHTELSTADKVVSLVYFESTEDESGAEITQQAHSALLVTDNAAWAQLQQQYNVEFEISIPPTDPPVATINPVGALDLWHWVVIVAGNTFLILLVLVLLYCCCALCRRRRRKQEKAGYKHHRLTEADHPYPSRQPLNPTSLEMNAYPGHPRKVTRITFRPKGMLQQLSHPLTVEELEPLVENTAALYNEYASIPSNMVSMAEVPPGAEDKNRYRDVLPNPYTRVSLFLKFGVANSDYINANYIRGYKDTSKTYIATQGPLQWTVADFWRMVWEQRVSTIIMVTGLDERGTNKCTRYWPDETINHSTTYEDLEVRLKRRLTASNKEYTTTTFYLAHKQKMVSREVTHFWFTGWPDHGVPMSAKPVVQFLLEARGHIREMPGPTVVHCSAGIGRTGVFIGADLGMQQLEEEGQVDLLKIVATLRQDRGGMVQTRDQYIFLHKILLEYAHYLSQVRTTMYRGVGFRGQGSFTQLQPTIEEESSDTLALLM